jgi:beta-mannosidase
MNGRGLALIAMIGWSMAGAEAYKATTSLEGDWRILAGDLAPANAYLADLDDLGWPTLRVPGNWKLQGKDYSGVVWHRKHFRAASLPPDPIVKLTFEAVDYAADVWLNGHYIGHHEGYFDPFSFEVQEQIKPSDENVLVVRVNSPNETPEGWPLRKRLIKGVLNHHDTRPGGAWSIRGQEQNTGGIWGPVTLTVSSKASIGRIAVTTRPEANGAWLAQVDAWFSTAGVNGPLRFEAEMEPDTFVDTGGANPAASATVPAGDAGGPVRLKLRAAKPRLWWTWDQGEPNLYRVKVRAWEGSRVVAEASARFGFRTVEVDQTTKQWRLNGRPLFLRGTNYISSQWLSEMDPAKVAFDLELMKRANINAIRAHAHLEGEAFYAQCDEKGLLISQDFPLQWGYEDSPEFAAEASRQALAMVRWLYNHPSIGAWILQNEPPFDADWMKWKYRDYNPEQNKTLSPQLARVVAEADATRWIHAYSPTNEHQWLGWYSGSWMDFAKPSKEAMITEYGAQALPRISSLRQIFTEAELWPKTDAEWAKWDYHNFQRHETVEVARIPQGSNIDEWIRNTQEYQAKLTRFAAENYRRQKYAPVTAIFQFLFNENWPSLNWGVVDYWRHPKPGYEALRIAYQPVLPSIAWTQDRWSPGDTPSAGLWIVNDLPREFSGARLTWTLRNAAKILQEGRLQANIAVDSAVLVSTLNFPGLKDGRYTLLVSLRDSAGRPLGENSFEFAVEAAVVSELKR